MDQFDISNMPQNSPGIRKNQNSQHISIFDEATDVVARSRRYVCGFPSRSVVALFLREYEMTAIRKETDKTKTMYHTTL